MVAAVLNPGDGSFGGRAAGAIDGLCTWSLQNIVMELCQRAGLDPRYMEASQLQPIQCRGFTTINSYPCSGSLQSLSQIFLFDPSNYDGKVHFILRGADAIDTITEDQIIVADDSTGLTDPDDQSSRSDGIVIPQRLNLDYFDVAGGLSTSLQVSERVGDDRATGEQSIQTAVILSADEAARSVKINHLVMAEDSKSQLNFSLTDSWLKLTTADCVFVSYNGKVRRCRLTTVALNDGQQDLQMLQDRQSAYRSKIQGYPAYIPTPAPDRITGQTIVEPLDIHLIDDHDDSLGCYIGIAGQTAGWNGAVVEFSYDGGASYPDSYTVTESSTIGKMLDPMTDHPLDTPDTINRARVQFDYPYDELTSVDPVQLYNRANLAIIGDEVVNFATAAETTTERVYELSDFLRGRNGTDSAAHAVNDRFVLLDRSALVYLPAQLAYIGRTITIRATSLNGDPDTDITTQTFTWTAQSQTEYKPAYLAARRAGSNAVVSWQGVYKLGAGVHTAPGLYFAGYHLNATDGSKTIEVDIADENYTFALAGFSGPITVAVSEKNQLTGNGPSISVIF